MSIISTQVASAHLDLPESTGNAYILNIKDKKKFGNKNFSFETVSKKDVLGLIKKLPGNKATVSNDIPLSVHKKVLIK